jgi:hypothetical protein
MEMCQQAEELVTGFPSAGTLWTYGANSTTKRQARLAPRTICRYPSPLATGTPLTDKESAS